MTKTEETIIEACEAAPRTGAELRSLTRGRSRLVLASMVRRGLLRSGIRGRDGAAVYSVPEQPAEPAVDHEPEPWVTCSACLGSAALVCAKHV